MAQKTVKVMFIGDVVGTPGLQMVGKMLKSFISKYNVDFVICNGENAHHGKVCFRAKCAVFVMLLFCGMPAISAHATRSFVSPRDLQQGTMDVLNWQ